MKNALAAIICIALLSGCSHLTKKHCNNPTYIYLQSGELIQIGCNTSYEIVTLTKIENLREESVIKIHMYGVNNSKREVSQGKEKFCDLYFTNNESQIIPQYNESGWLCDLKIGEKIKIVIEDGRIVGKESPINLP